MKEKAILIVQCPDQQGIVAAVSEFLYRHHGNIVEIDQYVNGEMGVFFMRVKWELKNFGIDPDRIAEVFGEDVANGSIWTSNCLLIIPSPGWLFSFRSYRIVYLIF